MRAYRIAHRLCAVTAIGTGAVVLHDGFTGDLTAHCPIALIWLTATLATGRPYRRMR